MADDFRDQIAAALSTATWGAELPTTAHADHRYHGACALCQGHIKAIADVAMLVVQPEIDRAKDLGRILTDSLVVQTTRSAAEARTEATNWREIAEFRQADLEQAEAERDQARREAAEYRQANTTLQQINTLRTDERDQLKATLAGIREALHSAHTVVATSSMDWGQDRTTAWIWGLFCGWDCEEPDDVHDPGDCNEGTLTELAIRLGWSADQVATLRRLRAAIAAIDQPRES